MAFLEWLCSKRAVALAAAGAVALGVGMVATPNEAAAQCSVVSTGPTDPGTVSTFEELRDGTVGPDDGDSVSVDCDNSIDSDSIVDGSITGTDIGTETITGANVDDGTLTGDDIQDGSIGSADLGTDSVTSDAIASGAVGSDEIATDAVTQDKIADDAVGADQLADDAVDNAAIQNDAVTQDKIADDAVGSAQIQENAVTASELADNAVDTAAIQNDAVTWDKLSSGVRDRVNENQEGVAVALALQNPDLVGNETFGLAVNWGGFESSNALGIAATGVLGHDLFGGGDRLAIAGGVGVGFDEDTVGGRVGAQLTW